MTLEGKVAIVTGVTSDIGKAIALRLGPAAILINGAAWRVRSSFLESAGQGDGVRPGPYGITVNVVAPGVVESPYLRANVTAEAIGKRLQRIPIGRLACPEDCAAAVAHVTSPDMDYVTGQILYVDGGFLSAGVIAK